MSRDQEKLYMTSMEAKDNPWFYPQNGDNPPLTEGTEIIAEFEILSNRNVITRKITREVWSAMGKEISYAWRYSEHKFLGDSGVRIIAWMPYVKPNPPEKPQYCPFCGSRKRLKIGE